MFEAEVPIKRVHRIERLVSFNPAHQESRETLWQKFQRLKPPKVA